MTAAALWTAVVASYDADGLISLTNIRDRSATTIDTTVGESAAQGVIDLWPIYAQIAYDASNATHVEAAKQGVIALLWRRGGTAASIAKVEWDEVFAADGLLSKVRSTGARSRRGPSTNSGVVTASELTEDGRNVRGWSDLDSMPHGILPSRRPVD